MADTPSRAACHVSREWISAESNMKTESHAAMQFIRLATSRDEDAAWDILEPIIRAGETYCLPQDWSRAQGLGYRFADQRAVFVAQRDRVVIGSYYMQANQLGFGDHVANCGYIVSHAHSGIGTATAMCLDSMARTRARGFTDIQFNFVISSNTCAVQLWLSLGFEIVGRLPGAFRPPEVTGSMHSS
jgi:L-amino acid N-acyltransferase YncA